MFKRLHRVVVVAAVCALLAACESKPLQFKSTDITGATFAQQFSLTDHTGKQRTLDDFKGKVAVIFFGFTHCPDVCPSTMINMKGVLEKLGPEQAKQVQVIFITVDPERDTQEVLAQYVPAFDASFVGLRGDVSATKKVTRDFKIFSMKVPGTTEGTYSVDHTAASYVFDKTGKVRLMVRDGANQEDVAGDIRLLLDS